MKISISFKNCKYLFMIEIWILILSYLIQRILIRIWIKIENSLKSNQTYLSLLSQGEFP